MSIYDAFMISTVILVGAVIFAAATVVYIKWAVEHDWGLVVTFAPWLIIVWLAVFLGFWLSSDEAKAQHPAKGMTDPYQGFTRADGKTSCCGSHDCAPAAWDEERGMIQLPDGTWTDPWSHVNHNQTRPALYFSFDRHAHACLSQGQLHCVFVPGSSASIRSWTGKPAG